MRTSDLIGEALDYAVAKCLAATAPDDERNYWNAVFSMWDDYRGATKYSSKWELGGPLLSEYRIETYGRPNGDWGANIERTYVSYFGPTLLVAAMRCLVASQVGDKFEDTFSIPKELL